MRAWLWVCAGVAAAALAGATAFGAETGPAADEQAAGRQHHALDHPWGVHPVLLAVGITIGGVGLRLSLGMINRRRRDFEPLHLVRSLILGWFASIGLVIGSVQHIPLDAADLTVFQILVGEVATVMGVDAAGHSVTQRLAERQQARNGYGYGPPSPPPPRPPPFPSYASPNP